MKCEKCGNEMREEWTALGFAEEGKMPPKRRVFTCMNKDCDMFGYPQKIEGLTLSF